MRKIAGPGHVNNEFKDYDPINNPTGTYIMADWANDVQRELIGIQDELSIPEADGSNKYILAAIKGLVIRHSKQLGELFYLNKYRAPAAFDKDNPEAFFPGLCLDKGDQVISSANWPDLVPELRTIRLTYREGTGSADYQFDVTNWAIVSNVATLTFANNDAENKILAALAEDNLVHGGYNSWRSITLPSAIGDITAGEYAITNLDPAARTVSFAFTAGDNSGSGSWTAEFYAHRIPGSSTTARVYERPAGVLVAANDADGECIAGLRRRDRGQGHGHIFDGSNTTVDETITGGDIKVSTGGGGTNRVVNISDGNTSLTGTMSIDEPDTDGTNGEPRTGKTTDPRAQVGHLYMWGKTYLS